MLPSISIRQLQYFAAVYEARSFSRAAERQNCSQPALSAQIRALEETLSNTLFERSVSGVVPTIAGERFYRHAVAILRSVHVAELEMADLGGQIAGVLRVGLIPSVVRGLLPSFLPRLVEAYPYISLRLVEALSGTLTEGVLSQELDFAVVMDPPRHEGLEMTSILAETLVLISGPALGLPPGQPLRLPDLPPLKLVVPSARHGLRDLIDRAIWTGEIKAARTLDMDSVHAMIEFAANSDWATILPMTAVSRDRGSRLQINPVAAPAFHVGLYLVHHKQFPLSSAAEVFVEALRAEAAKVEADCSGVAAGTGPEVIIG